MRLLLPYLPVFLFGLWGLYAHIKLPSWRNARYLHEPERGLWAPWHFFGNERWTDEGQVLRNRYLRHWFTAIALGIIGLIIVALVEKRDVSG